MLNDVTISLDLNQLLGGDIDTRRTRVYVKTNVTNGTLIDTSTGETRLGDERVTLEADGTGTFTTWGVGADGNPTSWQTYVVVEYPRAGSRDRVTRTFGPYTITDADDGKTLAELEDEQAIPAEYQTAFTQQAQSYLDAQAAIAGIDDTDSAVGALLDSDLVGPLSRAAARGLVAGDIGTPGSDIETALSASYGTVVPLTRLGGGPSKTGAENRAALQAGIDAGLTIFIPGGITQVAGGLRPRAGMRIIGFGKGYPDTDDFCSILRTVDGPLFLPNVESGDGFTNFASFQNVDLQAAFVADAPMMVGEWASTEFRNVRLRQYNPDHPVIDVTGWIDVTIDGASEITGPATTPHPLFRAVTDVSKIAQSAWRDIRVTGGENYQFWIEATGGDALDYAQGLVFDNINHEIPHGGGIKLLSCRGVTINACGSWDRSIAAPNDFIYIGAGSADHPSGAITISHCVRDASANPPTGTYDIKAEPGTFDLNMVNNGVHQGGAVGWRVDAGGATGRISGTLPDIFDNADNIRRDVGSTPTLAVNMVADPLFATDLDSDLWLAVDQTPTSSDGVLTMTGTAATFTVQTFNQAQRALAPCEAGVTYRVSAEVKAVGADKGVNLAINVYADETGASLLTSANVGGTAVSASWTPLTVTVTPGAAGVLSPQLGASLGIGTEVQWRNLHLEPVAYPAAFVHGDLPGCYWNGTPNRSQSYRSAAATSGDLPAGAGPVRSGSGATTARPNAVASGAGAMWFDTTLGQPIWSDGTGWVDATGTSV